MSLLKLIPAEQLAAQIIAGEIIASTAGDDPAKRVADAGIALEWATGVQQLADGDPTAALSALNAQLTKSSLDPAVLNGLQGMLQFGLQQGAIAAQVTSFNPLFGAVPKAIATNIAAGVTAAANIEISTYTPKIPTKAKVAETEVNQ